MGEQPPGDVGVQRPEDVVFNQPFRRALLEGDKPRADRPVKRADGHAQQAKHNQRGLPAVGFFGGHPQHFVGGRAGLQLDGVAVIATAAAHMTAAAALHMAQGLQRGAVDRTVRAVGRGGPAGFVHPVGHRRQFGQQGKHAIHRAQMPAPGALALGVHPAHRHGGDGGAAQHQQRRLRVLIDADHLAIHRGQHKGDKRPAAPAHPARNRPAQAFLRRPFGQCAFRAQHATPDAAKQHHRQQHKRPPDSPEHKLGEDGQVVQHARAVVRQRQQRRNHQQGGVHQHHRPLQPTQQRGVVAQPAAHRRQPPGGWGWGGGHGQDGDDRARFHRAAACRLPRAISAAMASQKPA